MLRNRGSRFDTGWLVTFSFFFILVEKNLLRNFLSVAKMASLVYERENCGGASMARRDKGSSQKSTWRSEPCLDMKNRKMWKLYEQKLTYKFCTGTH